MSTRNELIRHLDTMELRPRASRQEVLEMVQQMQINRLPECPRCGIHTDCLYRMEQFADGTWKEMIEAGRESECRICYNCCDDLEAGKEP